MKHCDAHTSDNLAADLIIARRDTCASVQREADLIRERDELSAFAAALLLTARPLAAARGDAEMDRLIAEVPGRARAMLAVVEAARAFAGSVDAIGTSYSARLKDALAALDGTESDACEKCGARWSGTMRIHVRPCADRCPGCAGYVAAGRQCYACGKKGAKS